MTLSTGLALRLERARSAGPPTVLVAAHDEHPRLALDDGVGVGAVVLVERVTGGLDASIRKRRKPASLAVNRKSTRLAPSVRATSRVPASSPLTNSRTVAGWATVEVTSADDLDLLADPGGRRGGQPLDQHLVGAVRGP